MKSLIVIMAHKEAQETFNRHLPIWRSLGGDLLVVHPKGSRVLLPEKQPCMTLEVGAPAHTGVESIIRMRTILEHMNGQGYDRYAFFEYDSFAFEWPQFDAEMAAPTFRDNSPNRGFIGTTYCHPPLFFTPKGLAIVTESAKQLPLQAEGSVWDRWLGLALERAGLKPFDLIEAGLAFSDNTIHEPRYPALFQAVRNGAVCVHGVKDKACLDVIFEAREIAEASNRVRKAGGKVTWNNE